jgi:SOS-response transcriptional repressor LexA
MTVTSSKKIKQANSAKVSACRVNLKKLLLRDHLSVCEFARRINLPQPTIHRLLTGKTEDPMLSTLSLISDYFAISIDQLLGSAPLPGEQKNTSVTMNPIPILSWQEALDFQQILPNLSKNSDENWILVDANISPLTFAVKSKKWMEPRFPNGSILVVDPKQSPNDGDLVVVSYPNTSECTIRELMLDGPNQSLVSVVNSAVFDKFTKDIVLIGVVVQMRFSYR